MVKILKLENMMIYGGKKEMTHADLVELGRKWMFKRAPVVITEVKACAEEPDVFGLYAKITKTINGRKEGGFGNALIECKASRADFLSDFKKSFRQNPEIGIGKLRYYLAPKGLISVNELPNGWGLLETSGKRIKIVKLSSEFIEYNHEREMTIIVSTLRRLNIPDGEHCSIRTYTYKTKNRATLSINKEIKDGK